MPEPRQEQWRRYVVRKTTLKEQDEDPDLENTTAAECLGMMWQLTLDAWAFTGQPLAESRLPHDLMPAVQQATP